MKIRITATSFILPANQGWRGISANHKLIFGEYGDWITALREKSETALLWVFFLDDIAPDASVADAAMPEDQMAALLEPALQALQTRLAGSTAATVVAWSSWREESPIRQAKQASARQQLGRKLECALQQWASENRNLYLLSLDEIFARNGINTCFDNRNFYASHCRLSSNGLQALAQAAGVIFERLAGPPKKVLALDCDDTLWGGVVGEVGVSGLTLGQDGIGQAYVDFQRAAARLGREGVLLVLVSKNNEEDVWEVFSKHPAMALKKSDFTAWRINWQDKAANLEALAEDLDLGLDDFVFWDDNALERQRLHAQLPQVLIPDITADVTLWPRLLNTMDAFARFVVTFEDRKKVQQYRNRSAFVANQRSALDERAFLTSIALEPRPLVIDVVTLSRAAQLCAKTNQFNLRTMRYQESAIMQLSERVGDLAFMVHLKDHFGDHGNVGMVIACPDVTPGVAFLDTFLMSCRVLGRHLEAWMLWTLKERLMRRGMQWLLAERRPTSKNAVAEDFLAQHGLTPLATLDGKVPAALMKKADALCEGECYAVQLDAWTVPYMDIYTHA